MCFLFARAVMQTELQRFNYDKYCLQRLEYSFRDQDPCRSGLVDRQALASILKGNRLPIDKQIIDFFVNK